MKILLFGKSGQLGWELERSLAPLGEVVAPRRQDPELCGDLVDLEGVAQTVRKVRPEVVVVAAAYTAVDRAEDEAAIAGTINAEAPSVLAAQAQALGAWLLHFSSDYVFDGSGTLPWREADAARPLSEYGRSKLEGERRVASQCERHLILRTSWLYSARGANFATAILRQARERDHMQVVDDQVGAPTSAELLADVSAHVLRDAMAKPGLAGLYHVAAGGETTRHGYARYLLERAAQAGVPLNTAPGRIEPVPTSKLPGAAERPLNSRLDTTKLRSAFGLRLPHWTQGVDRMVAQAIGTGETKA